MNDDYPPVLNRPRGVGPLLRFLFPSFFVFSSPPPHRHPPFSSLTLWPSFRRDLDPCIRLGVFFLLGASYLSINFNCPRPMKYEIGLRLFLDRYEMQSIIRVPQLSFSLAMTLKKMRLDQRFRLLDTKRLKLCVCVCVCVCECVIKRNSNCLTWPEAFWRWFTFVTPPYCRVFCFVLFFIAEYFFLFLFSIESERANAGLYWRTRGDGDFFFYWAGCVRVVPNYSSTQAEAGTSSDGVRPSSWKQHSCLTWLEAFDR